MSQNAQHVVLAAVIDERTYQDQKWGTVDENPHTVGEWLLIAEAELAEAKAAWLKTGDMQPVLAEVRQVAIDTLSSIDMLSPSATEYNGRQNIGVAVACLEQHGVRFRQHDGGG